MLSNAYSLAKVRFGTAENEPAKNLQNLQILLTQPAQVLPGQPQLEPNTVEHLLHYLPQVHEWSIAQIAQGLAQAERVRPKE